MGTPARWYDETDDFVSHLNKRDDIDLRVHGGDVALCRIDEFLWQRDIGGTNQDTLCGTSLWHHNRLGTGEEIIAIFGDPTLSFHCRTGKVCLPEYQRHRI